jgi:uncharacterized protein involved in tolerance to divalent cations
MKTADLKIALVTAPELETARQLGKLVLEAKLAACVNLVPGIESHYWWQGKIDSGSEILMLIKTTEAKISQLEKLILKSHPYDTAEFVVISASEVTEKYFNWVLDSVKG